MGQRAGGPFRQVLHLLWHESFDPAQVVRATDHRDAVSLLRGSKQDSVEMAGIRGWGRSLGIRAGDTDVVLLGHPAQAVIDGRIVIIARESCRCTIAADAVAGMSADWAREPQDRPMRRHGQRPSPPSQAPALPVDQDRWIELWLVDETTGKSISGVPFKIHLVDGPNSEQTTDQSGKIPVDGIDPGTCGILEIRTDDGPEVTSFG